MSRYVLWKTQRMMSDSVSRSKAINRCCVPLFIHDAYLSDGHNETTLSATATLVRRFGICYLVTCLHVKREAHSNPRWTASVHAGKTVINLNHWSKDGIVPSLRDVDDEFSSDICISTFDDCHLDILNKTKPKSPIDLDRYQEPSWRDIQFGHAAGFPDQAKIKQGDHVASSMVEVIAELASAIGPSAPTFTLQSEISDMSPHGFSGMSGGPIFVGGGEKLCPLGIIFEGAPSGQENQTSSNAFLTERDILIRGCLLTPTTFDNWLRSAGFH